MLNYNWMPEKVKTALWPIVLEQCNVCMTYAATLCNPFATLMKVGGGEREENCV